MPLIEAARVYYLMFEVHKMKKTEQFKQLLLSYSISSMYTFLQKAQIISAGRI